MLTVSLGDYRIKSLLYESAGSLLYRGERQADRCPVVIKLLKDLYLTPEKIAWFHREYELTRRLQMPGVITTYGFEWLQTEGELSHPAMILEDFGGDSLLLLGMTAGIPLEPFFAVAIAVLDAIAGVHQAHVIHKDLNPSNIIYNPATGQVALIDFGIATDLDQETLPFLNPTCLEGTLPYLAPEQTGRVNRSLDYRTDYYALGVTFYQLLTGQLPFEADDPLGWIHHHIAKQPQFDAAVRSRISDTLAAIVLKLMAKNADDRYQSIQGLRHDLQRCRDAYAQTGQILPFHLGKADHPDRLRFPQTLYGRASQREHLLNLFQATVAAERHYALISGVSGVGKTALVQELYQPITTQSGFFVAGKYDQQHRNQPYAGFAQAFDQLGRLVLTASHTRFVTWQQKVQAAVGNNGQVLLDVVPIWEQILGPQPPVPALGWQETQHRFHQVFSQFVAALCDPSHPLVVFIDDWQWADMASLTLLKTLLTQPNLHYFLFLGAYRSNEVDRGHPFLTTLATLTDPTTKFTPQYHALGLENLTVADVTQLLADTLKLAPEDCAPLAALVYEKTAGNPFFTREFLVQLYRDRLLQRQGKQWLWNIDTLRTRNLTDNVVALMADRLEELPPASLETVKLAACIGDRFDIATLAQIRHASVTATLAHLMPLLQAGILLPLDHYYQLLEGGDEAQGFQARFRFLHDRVQQAAYSLLADAQKPTTHLHIGQTLLAQTDLQTLGDQVFTIVNHLNLGAARLESDADRQQLARLNLLAGQKAQQKSADTLAYEYFEQGIHLIAPSLAAAIAPPASAPTNRPHAPAPNDCHELYRHLLTGAATTAAMTGNYGAMTQWVERAIAQADSPDQRAAIRTLEIKAAISQDQRSQAIHIALTTLAELGITLPAQPTETAIAEALQLTAALFAPLTCEQVVALPESQDPNTLAATQILVEIISVCFNCHPQLMLLVITRLIQISLQQGPTPLTPFAYTAYGLILCGVLQNFELGERAGQVALGLLNRFGDRSMAIRARTLHMIRTFIDHWRHPLASIYPHFLTDYALALETGDREFAAHSVHMCCWFRFLCGGDLKTVEAEMATYADVIEQLNKPASLTWQRIWWQTVANLRGQSADPCQLDGAVYNEQESLAVQRAKGDVTGQFLVYWLKATLSYRWRNYSQAYACIDTSESYLSGVIGLALIPIWHLDLALICSALLVPPSSRPTHPVPDISIDFTKLEQRMAEVEAALERWGARSPSYTHRLALLAAERYRRQGNWVEAMGFYDQAIDGAIAQGFLNEAAIAAELALQMMQAWGKTRLMRTYFQETRLLYSRWGAIAKLDDLKQRYPDLWHLPMLAGATSQSPASKAVMGPPSPLYTSPVHHSDSLERLDLHSILKASQSLARDLDLETLLGHMMTILLENAGAERGYLLVPDADDWWVLAEGQVGKSTIVGNQLPARRSLTDLPNAVKIRKVLAYVGHTQAAWVPASDALGTDGISRLGLPLYNQGQLVAMLYLENGLVPHAFTAERLEVLQLLSGQIASSLQNAQLYAQLQDYSQHLEHKVAERTQELIHLNQELRRLAITDGLTKVYNRRYFDQQLRLEWQRLQREQIPLSLLLFDVDHFKAYNDYYGHQAGDDCLIQIAQATQEAVHRPADLVARYGGEEFTVILPNTDQAGAITIATHIRQSIQARAIPHARSLVNTIVSISLGIATVIPTPECSPEKLISLADQALYTAKREGRDRIAIAPLLDSSD